MAGEPEPSETVIEYRAREKDRLHLIRAIVAMANTAGGEITLEPRGIEPQALDAGTLERAVGRYVAPRVVGIESREQADGRVVIVVPESETGPHVFTRGGCCDDDEPGSPPGVQAAGAWVFHPGQIWVGHGSDVAPATADKVQEMIRAAASRFLERLSIGIRDPAFSLRLTESEGTPVHLAESEESVPVSPNLERLYPYTTKTLGEKLCRTTNWVAMAVKVLRLKESKEFAYGVSSPTGRIIQWRYSEPACGRLREKLERYPEWDPYHVW